MGREGKENIKKGLLGKLRRKRKKQLDGKERKRQTNNVYVFVIFKHLTYQLVGCTFLWADVLWRSNQQLHIQTVTQFE